MKHEDFNYVAFEVGSLYTRNEVADIGGVVRRPDRAWSGMTSFKNCLLLWITLDKSDKQEDHRYNDCFIDDGRTLVWDSQNRNKLSSPVIQGILKGRPVVLMARVSDRAKNRVIPARLQMAVRDHDAVAWVGRGEVVDYRIAPVDIPLLGPIWKANDAAAGRGG